MLVLYRAVVLPHLEYCCQLWTPTSLGQIRKIEAVQRTFTARLVNMETLDYWQRLKKLGLYSLERRRERYLALYMYKILNGMTPEIVGSHGAEVIVTESLRRGRLCAIPKINRRAPASVQTLLEGSLPINGAKIFNSLPRSLRECEGGLSAFKGRLDEYLRSVPDCPYLPHYQLPSLTNSLAAYLI